MRIIAMTYMEPKPLSSIARCDCCRVNYNINKKNKTFSMPKSKLLVGTIKNFIERSWVRKCSPMVEHVSQEARYLNMQKPFMHKASITCFDEAWRNNSTQAYSR
jgi:hypothetical protein